MGELLTRKELAARLRLKPLTVYRLTQQGKLPPPIRLSPQILRYDWDEVWKVLQKSKEKIGERKHTAEKEKS